MKTLNLLKPIVLAVTLVFAGCEEQNQTENNNNNNNNNNNIVNIERDIVYSVNSNENRSTLETEAEWDALLEQFCELTRNGNEVLFYNISPSSHHDVNKKASKESRTISTTNRNEIKAWMKEMEKEGLTVRVTYDGNTGTWNGVAYTTTPATNTSGYIIGTWHFSCMVVTQMDANGTVQSSDLYVPENSGGSMYYTFYSNGTVTLTINGTDGSEASQNSTWTLSEDGVLCTELMPNGDCWNVNWISPSTMIISHAETDSNYGDLVYQLQFDAVTTDK